MNFRAFSLMAIACLACLSSNLHAQQTKPAMSYETRIQLAHQLMEPVKQIVINDPNSSDRNSFVEQMAHLDPAWAAKFILENPVEENGQLRDHAAKFEIFSHANEVDEKDLVRLFEQSSLMRPNYALAALKCLPGEKKELRKRIAELTFEIDSVILWDFQSLFQVANLLESPEATKKMESMIFEYYQSGKASDAFAELKTRHAESEASWQKDLQRSLTGRLAASAPKEFRQEFLSEDSVSQRDVHWIVVLSDDFDRQTRLDELAKVERFDFGSNSFQMDAASSLGVVALLDFDLARRWADEAPNAAAKILAQLSIAPTLAKTDKLAAVQMIKSSYLELSKLDTSDRGPSNYNYPPSLLSAIGLRFVENVEPNLLPQCVEITVDLTRAQFASRNHTAQNQQFNSIVGIARYDYAKAAALFAEIADDVMIEAAPSFFLAQLAIDPDQVGDEYQSLPEPEPPARDYRNQVRSVLLPALTARDDSAFWNALSNHSGLYINPQILAK